MVGRSTGFKPATNRCDADALFTELRTLRSERPQSRPPVTDLKPLRIPSGAVQRLFYLEGPQSPVGIAHWP